MHAYPHPHSHASTHADILLKRLQIGGERCEDEGEVDLIGGWRGTHGIELQSSRSQAADLVAGIQEREVVRVQSAHHRLKLPVSRKLPARNGVGLSMNVISQLPRFDCGAPAIWLSAL